MKTKEIIALIICIAIPLITGGVSGIATASSISNWFLALNKPVFNPPSFLFDPVWTMLYILMGVSLFLIWRSPKGKKRKNALMIFSIQLLLNFAWSFLFFYFRQIGFALLEIIVLWVLILIMIILFHRVSKTAAWLQIPYILWVSFASALNAGIWILN
jgi:translocator protein